MQNRESYQQQLNMCHSAFLFTLLLISSLTNAESTEEQQAFPPSTLNFHDIYSNTLALLADETLVTGKEQDFHISNMPSQFVEFRQAQSTTPPSTTTIEITTESTEKSESSEKATMSATSTTTEEAEESSVKVMPIGKNYERGVLDLLFPANRVRSFKSVFDSFKRILSHTF